MKQQIKSLREEILAELETERIRRQFEKELEVDYLNFNKGNLMSYKVGSERLFDN